MANLSLSLLWNVEISTGAVGTDLELPWHVYTFCNTEDLNIQWHVYELATQDMGLLWNVATKASLDRTLLWNVRRVQASGDLSLPWNIRTFTPKDLALLWNVFTGAPVYRDMALLWRLKGLTQKDLELLWNVISLSLTTSLAAMVVPRRSFLVRAHGHRDRGLVEHREFEAQVEEDR